MRDENVASATRILNLIKQQFVAGTASDLNVAQQESLVNTLRATVPPLVQTQRQNQATLALLIARPPERAVIRGGGLRAIAIPRVTPGLPSELIAQRPDIRQAEAQLAAANANVYNARAQLLPSITLTGEGGYQSAVLKTLLRPELAFYTATAGLTQPIFEGGKLLGNLDLQKGIQDQLLQNYRKAVISAFTDVDNALIAVRETALAERLQQDVVNSSQPCLRSVRSATARRHGQLDHALAGRADTVPGPRRAGASAAGAAAGNRKSLSSARRRLAAKTGGNDRCTVNCRSKSRRRRKGERAVTWRSYWFLSR